MTDENLTPPRTGAALGAHLAAIRSDRGYSLRQVEGLTNNVISNAYLSQIESGKIQQPSPNILHALANVYKISYEQLMELAGFITSNREKGDVTHGRAATFAELNLSEDEERELLEYLKFRRGLKG
jgi:transcriptional regulator with XRE-family HTH domain